MHLFVRQYINVSDGQYLFFCFKQFVKKQKNYAKKKYGQIMSPSIMSELDDSDLLISTFTKSLWKACTFTSLY